MEIVSAILALCEGNPLFTNGFTGPLLWQCVVDFPHKGTMTQGFDVYFDVVLNTLLNKQSSCR